MRKLILFCACSVLLSAAEYPGAHWEKHTSTCATDAGATARSSPPIGSPAAPPRTRNSIPAARFGPQTGYGFLWWTEDWGYSALGAGGHVIAIVPGKDLVIVHRVAYDPPQEDFVAYRDVDTMIRMVIAAAPSVNPVN